MSNLNIADKSTMDSVNTNVTYIKDNLPSGSASSVLVIKNTDSEYTGVSFTVSCADFTQTVIMPNDDSVEVTVPYVGEYEINCTYGSWKVNVLGIGKTITEYTVDVVPFSTGTDEQIKTMLDAYYANKLTWSEMGWAIGDTRTISLASMQAPNPNSSNTWAAQDITVVIVAHDHTDLATPINGHTKACITVQTREVLNNNTSGYNQAGHIYINGTTGRNMTFTKWSNLYTRIYLNDKVWGAFPVNFKNIIKPSTHYRHTTYNGTESEQVTDNLFLPSYPEIFGTTTSAAFNNYVVTSPAEGTQFEYYETESNRIKYGNNNGVSNGVGQYWWQGSPSSYYHSSNGYYWCSVESHGYRTHNLNDSANGLAPAWAM